MYPVSNFGNFIIKEYDGHFAGEIENQRGSVPCWKSDSSSVVKVWLPRLTLGLLARAYWPHGARWWAGGSSMPAECTNGLLPGSWDPSQYWHSKICGFRKWTLTYWSLECLLRLATIPISDSTPTDANEMGGFQIPNQAMGNKDPTKEINWLWQCENVEAIPGGEQQE